MLISRQQFDQFFNLFFYSGFYSVVIGNTYTR